MKPLFIDSVIANVYDLDQVCEKLFQRFGLKPFMRMNVPIKNETVPMALFNIGKTTLEFLQYAQTPADPQHSGIESVCIVYPVEKPFIFDLEKGLTLEVQPADQPGLKTITLRSTAYAADTAAMTALGGNLKSETNCTLGNIDLVFKPIANPVKTNPNQASDPSRNAGWRRFSLKGETINDMLRRLENIGCRVVEPVFQVMPGLEEAFVLLPSGVMMQPVQENMVKLLASTAWIKISHLFNTEKSHVN